MKKKCNCSSEKRSGNHYNWCQSSQDVVEKEEFVDELVEEPKICNCNSVRRGGNHYGWCDAYVEPTKS
jgi:hypothetical protein